MAFCAGCDRECFERRADDVQEYRVKILHACDGTILFDSDLIGLTAAYQLIDACNIPECAGRCALCPEVHTSHRVFSPKLVLCHRHDDLSWDQIMAHVLGSKG